MNIKSFAMLAMSGLLAASCAYIAPAMADDTSTPSSGQSMQAPADNSAQSGNGMQNNGSSQGDMNSNNNGGSNSSGSSSSSSDEGSPDTATGDDDY